LDLFVCLIASVQVNKQASKQTCSFKLAHHYYSLKSMACVVRTHGNRYGTRCIAGHGSSASTLAPGGAIGSLKDFASPRDLKPSHSEKGPPRTSCTEEQCNAVIKSLNAWRDDIKENKESFAPSRTMVVNCMRISYLFVKCVSRAASLAVLGHPDRALGKIDGVLTQEGRKAMQCTCLHDGTRNDALWMWWGVSRNAKRSDSTTEMDAALGNDASNGGDAVGGATANADSSGDECGADIFSD